MSCRISYLYRVVWYLYRVVSYLYSRIVFISYRITCRILITNKLYVIKQTIQIQNETETEIYIHHNVLQYTNKQKYKK